MFLQFSPRTKLFLNNFKKFGVKYKCERPSCEEEEKLANMGCCSEDEKKDTGPFSKKPMGKYHGIFLVVIMLLLVLFLSYSFVHKCNCTPVQTRFSTGI